MRKPENTVRFQLVIKPEPLKAVKRLARKRRLKISNIIVEAIEKYLKALPIV